MAQLELNRFFLGFDDDINVDVYMYRWTKATKHTRTKGIIQILTKETFLLDHIPTPHAALTTLDHFYFIQIGNKVLWNNKNNHETLKNSNKRDTKLSKHIITHLNIITRFVSSVSLHIF